MKPQSKEHGNYSSPSESLWALIPHRHDQERLMGLRYSHNTNHLNGELIGVMGIQCVKDVTLIRHSYIRMMAQGQGVGSKLLSFLSNQTTRPILIGTWADAAWAIRFFEKRGFRLVALEEKDRLLKKYWSIPERQTETSVVLADQKWFENKSSSQ